MVILTEQHSSKLAMLQRQRRRPRQPQNPLRKPVLLLYFLEQKTRTNVLATREQDTKGALTQFDSIRYGIVPSCQWS